MTVPATSPKTLEAFTTSDVPRLLSRIATSYAVSVIVSWVLRTTNRPMAPNMLPAPPPEEPAGGHVSDKVLGENLECVEVFKVLLRAE